MNLGFIGTGKIASSVITEDAILPVPIKPKIIIFWLLYIDYIELINKKRSSNSQQFSA